MKLRSKKTGEIRDVQLGNHNDPSDGIIVVYSENNEPREPHQQYSSLAELNEEWEDYEEPKRTWFIDTTYVSDYIDYDDNPITDHRYDELGICFETKEEAEKAVEKLKAWKRLKDNGFKFTGWERDHMYCGDFTITAIDQTSCDNKDLDLLFGEE